MAEVFIDVKAIEEVKERFRKAAEDVPDEVLEPVGEKLGNEALRLYQGTVRTWEHAVSFEKIVNARGGSVEVLVGTDDFVYGIVNDGSRPHTITARSGKLLVFNANYAPKTTPGSLQSRRGGASGPLVFARSVRHPGTQARGFTDKITEKVEEKAGPELDKAVGRWVRKI